MQKNTITSISAYYGTGLDTYIIVVRRDNGLKQITNSHNISAAQWFRWFALFMQSSTLSLYKTLVFNDEYMSHHKVYSFSFVTTN